MGEGGEEELFFNCGVRIPKQLPIHCIKNTMNVARNLNYVMDGELYLAYAPCHFQTCVVLAVPD